MAFNVRSVRSALGSGAFVFFCACSPSPAGDAADAAGDSTDASGDVSDMGAPDTVVEDHGGLLQPRCEETEPSGGARDLPAVASTLVATVEPIAMRLALADPSPTMNPVTESGERAYRAMMLDQYRAGPGWNRMQRTDLGGATSFDPAQRRSLAYFVHVSDYQYVDDESPARYARLDNPSITSGIRPQEGLLPRAVSATHRNLARIERAGRPYDFGIVTGDCADSAQLNELRWFMTQMNGGRIHADSGEDNDPIPGPDNDAKDAFDSAGFPAPWLYVPGNHDVLQVGINLPTDAIRAMAIGSSPTQGTRDYRRWYAPVTTSTVPADPDRRIIDRAEIVRELRTGAATPGPVGHGYPESPDLRLGANYTYDAIPNVVRIVALDTSDPFGGSPGMVLRETIDGWLVPELRRAQTDGVLVFMASHHATTAIDRRMGQLGGDVANAVAPGEIEALVASYPNVVVWLVGHQHTNRVRAIRGADAMHPGYWEIETDAIADFPSQTRIVELVDNGNGTLSIFGTMIDFDTQNCLERRYRRLAMMDFLSGWEDPHSGTPTDRNVELVIPVPSGAAARLTAARATAPMRIESETTLRGMP